MTQINLYTENDWHDTFQIRNSQGYASAIKTQTQIFLTVLVELIEKEEQNWKSETVIELMNADELLTWDAAAWIHHKEDLIHLSHPLSLLFERVFTFIREQDTDLVVVSKKCNELEKYVTSLKYKFWAQLSPSAFKNAKMN